MTGVTWYLIGSKTKSRVLSVHREALHHSNVLTCLLTITASLHSLLHLSLRKSAPEWDSPVDVHHTFRMKLKKLIIRYNKKTTAIEDLQSKTCVRIMSI